MKIIIGYFTIWAGIFIMQKFFTVFEMLGIAVFVIGFALWLDGKIESSLPTKRAPDAGDSGENN